MGHNEHPAQQKKKKILKSSLLLNSQENGVNNAISPRMWSVFRRRQWHPTPVFLPGKSHGWRSLVGRSPWGHEESDTTERLHFHFSLSCIGEGNDNPFQCSCLENPRDGGAWWAAVYGVAQSRTSFLTSDRARIAVALGSLETLDPNPSQSRPGF